MSSGGLVEAFRALHLVTKRVHQSLDLTTTLDAVAQGVADVAGFGVAVVNLIRPDGGYEVVSVAGDEDARAALLGTVERSDAWDALLAGSTRLGQLHFIDGRTTTWDDDSVFSWVPDLEVSQDEDAWHPMDALFAPLTASSGQWLGVLSVDLPVHGRRPDAGQRELLELFADHAAIAIEHARMHGALQDREADARYAATHDPLTGLANRALLMSTAEEMAARPDVEVAVLLVDLDDFKQVNDTAGHRAGDEVLKTISRRLQHAVRDTDVVARTGGDEFVIVMCGTDLAPVAASLAQRLRSTLARPIRDGDEHGGGGRVHRVGASVGVAVGRTPVDVSALLSQADAAMYEGKRRRRRLRDGDGRAARRLPVPTP